MAEFKELIKNLCTEEMIDNGTAPIVYYKGKAGHLLAFDAGLGFKWISKPITDIYTYGVYYELSEDELDLSLIMKDDESYIGNRTPVIAGDKLYEFGHYTKHGCVVYEMGEYCDKKPIHFKVDEIHVPTEYLEK